MKKKRGGDEEEEGWRGEGEGKREGRELETLKVKKNVTLCDIVIKRMKSMYGWREI